MRALQEQTYREGETLFLQPQVIIPLPVSKFTETGRTRATEGARPWKDERRIWHLEKRCGRATREMMLILDELIRDRFPVDGPRWGQKLYVAYRLENWNWLTVETPASLLRLKLLVDAGAFDEAELANRLGVKILDKEESLAEKLGWPGSVLVESRTEDTDRIVLRIKEDFDLESEGFPAFLREAYEAYARRSPTG